MSKSRATRVPFKLHPRVFAALGSDLVTNDFVAITELVKNSYDAFADDVNVSFGSDPESGNYIEILDNGSGMTRKTIEKVWCVVATPHRAQAIMSRKGKKVRRVSGEKGLGRLSMARLGDRLEMLTQAKNSSCLKVNVIWSSLSGAATLDKCFVTIEKYDGEIPFQSTGTRLRIFHLANDWDEEQISELRDHLSRLISPFNEVKDFAIRLHAKDEETTATNVDSPKFLQHPKYRLIGKLTDDGQLHCKYTYAPFVTDRDGRKKTKILPWEKIQELSRSRGIEPIEAKSRAIQPLLFPSCGQFHFEIRAWDIDTSGVSEIVEEFKLKKLSLVRSGIRAHKGISIYRDGILVLPKSEGARDWLRLDLRRVSELGTRLSTSQIVGYVGITAKENPGIKDTSDRERLTESLDVTVFEEILKSGIWFLEQERLADRIDAKSANQPMKNLLGALSAQELIEQVKDTADRGGTAKETMPLVTEFSRSLEKARKEVERRFIYYSRLATIGTLAQMLVHEVRNKTTVVGNFLRAIAESKILEEAALLLREKFDRSSTAISGLDRLAETFLPLASRSFGRGRRHSVLEDRIAGALALYDADFRKREISIKFTAKTSTPVAVDPGELDAVLINVIDNAVYWLGQETSRPRVIDIRLSRIQSGARVRVGIHDSGPGVSEDNAEKIFWPGITTKPSGIGMGLTIASEIVDAHDGKMALQQPGELDGASFSFDLPVKSN